MAWEASNGVIIAGQDTIRIYASETSKISSNSIIAELTDIGEIGQDRETRDIGGYHKEAKVKVPGTISIKDITFTENLKIEELNKKRQWFENKTPIYFAIVDHTNENAIITKLYGTIISWSVKYPDGDVATLTYTISVLSLNPEITLDLGA